MTRAPKPEKRRFFGLSATIFRLRRSFYLPYRFSFQILKRTGKASRWFLTYFVRFQANSKWLCKVEPTTSHKRGHLKQNATAIRRPAAWGCRKEWLPPNQSGNQFRPLVAPFYRPEWSEKLNPSRAFRRVALGQRHDREDLTFGTTFSICRKCNITKNQIFTILKRKTSLSTSHKSS